jgi:hypothetical protein
MSRENNLSKTNELAKIYKAICWLDDSYTNSNSFFWDFKWDYLDRVMI